MLPIKVSNEYKLKNNVVAAIFEEFDLLELKQAEGEWLQMMVVIGRSLYIQME